MRKNSKMSRGIRHYGGSMGFKSGAVVQIGSRYAGVITNLITTMILARILTPEQFGVMAIITVILGLFTTISNAGINAAVIQYRDFTDNDLGKLFAFTIVTGVTMSLFFAFLSIPISFFYSNAEYVPLMCMSSIAVFFQSANMVLDGVQIRDRRFGLNGLRIIVSVFVGGIASVFLALSGWGIYALVANTVLQSLIIFFWNVVASGVRPIFIGFLEPVKCVMKFSVFQSGAQIAQYLIRNLDNLLVGYFMGSSALGLYDKAYKLSKYPVDYIPGTVTPIVRSYFSSLSSSCEKFYFAFLKVQKLLAAAGIGIGAIVFFAGQELILVLYGSQWTDSIELFQLLSISIPFQLVNFTVFSALEGLKRTDLLFQNLLVNSVVTVLLLAYGIASDNLKVVAFCVSVSFILATPTFLWFVVHKGFGQSVLKYLRIFIPACISGFVTVLVLFLVTSYLPQNIFLSLVCKILIGGGIYLIFLILLGGLKDLS